MAFGYYLGAGLMIAAGLVEWCWSGGSPTILEDIATPLTTVEDAEDAAPAASSREEAPAASGFGGASITDQTM